MSDDKPHAGRPTLLTDALQAKIVNLIEAGCYPEVAAGAVGVSRATFCEWMQRAAGAHPTRPTTPELTQFADAISEAVDKSEVRLVLKTAEYEEGARKHKRIKDRRVKSRLTFSQIMAVQWKLSRRFPERWGVRPASVNVGVNAPEEPGDGERGVKIQITYAAEPEPMLPPPLEDEALDDDAPNDDPLDDDAFDEPEE